MVDTQCHDFTLDLVRTLQGDGPTVRSLVRRTASLTTGLAEQDELIGRHHKRASSDVNSRVVA